MIKITKTAINLFWVCNILLLGVLVFLICAKETSQSELTEKDYGDVFFQKLQQAVETTSTNAPEHCKKFKDEITKENGNVLSGNFCYVVGFAKDWKKHLGNVLYVAPVSKRQPSLLMIIESEEDKGELKKLEFINEWWKLNIQVWTIQKVEEKFFIKNFFPGQNSSQE